MNLSMARSNTNFTKKNYTTFLEFMALCEARVSKGDLKYILRNRSSRGSTAFQMCEKDREKHELQ